GPGQPSWTSLPSWRTPAEGRDPAPRSIVPVARDWMRRAVCRNVVVIRRARAPPDHNRIWLIQRGRGNGPLKPRQPASREHRAWTNTVPIPTRARGEDEEIFR